MPNTQLEVVASLEGMKVVLTPKTCELHAYNFEENCWNEIGRSARPMKATEAKIWLEGWNDVDHNAAFVLLTNTIGS